MKTYAKQYFGDHEAVELAIRIYDRIFRKTYNVYGGKRALSEKDSDGNYHVIMLYSADWNDFDGLLPEGSPKGIDKRFNHKMSDIPENVDELVWWDVIKEI